MSKGSLCGNGADSLMTVFISLCPKEGHSSFCSQICSMDTCISDPVSNFAVNGGESESALTPTSLKVQHRDCSPVP